MILMLNIQETLGNGGKKLYLMEESLITHFKNSLLYFIGSRKTLIEPLMVHCNSRML